jgi:hypothetical protein
MRSKLIIFITLLSFAVFFSACGGGADNTANATNTKANANAPAPNSNGGIETTKKPEAATTNDAPTLKPVVVAYYDALKKKDDAALKAVLSAELIKSIEEDMKSEKKIKFAEFVAETDEIPEKGIEVRNEKINGDKGVAEVKGGTYLNWTAIAFVREGGVWKMSNESPDIESVTKGK